MTALAGFGGALMVVAVLWDAFETILLPRRVAGQFRITRLVQRGSWALWSWAVRPVKSWRRRENVLGLFAMLTLLILLGVWATGLILGFAILQWAAGSRLLLAGTTPNFAVDLYESGTTFFTLGLGDVVPISTAARILTVIEAGTGFGFLALVVAYVPVLYQSFSRRESRITMLDEWAGSPPSAVELLQRCAESGDPNVIVPFLRDWEVAAAELMETHLSYPILAYFRSQHDNQSWLAALTALLDACALILVGVKGLPAWQAGLTFAMIRHTTVDLSQVFRRRPMAFDPDRLPPETLARVRTALASSGIPLREGPEAEQKLAELRGMYEPYIRSLADYLLVPVPSWLPAARRRFNWQTTAWAQTGREHAH